MNEQKNSATKEKSKYNSGNFRMILLYNSVDGPSSLPSLLTSVQKKKKMVNGMFT